VQKLEHESAKAGKDTKCPMFPLRVGTGKTSWKLVLRWTCKQEKRVGNSFYAEHLNGKK